MTNPKEKVWQLLDTLPDETSFEEIRYHIYVLQAIERGIEAADRDELVDQDEMEQRMATWTSSLG